MFFLLLKYFRNISVFKKFFLIISYCYIPHYFSNGEATMIILCVTYATLQSENKTFCTSNFILNA